jgi:hypothetical protein
MTEMLEPFKLGETHKTEDPKCPFCPLTKNEQHYQTYEGEKNDGGKLGNLINEPEKFGVSIEADARPKNGKAGKDGLNNQNFADTTDEKEEKVKKKDTDWTFQAHHAISGNQCLKGHKVEKYIKAGDKVKYDTGYSVNNPQNGIWLPSSPIKHAWPTDPADKFSLAKKAMNTFHRQFHLGHHNISVDSAGLDRDTDQNYADAIKKLLSELQNILSAWEFHCPEKDEKGKHRGNPIIHNALDQISKHIILKLKGNPSTWKFFVSRHARDYTIKVRNPKIKLDFER